MAATILAPQDYWVPHPDRQEGHGGLLQSPNNKGTMKFNMNFVPRGSYDLGTYQGFRSNDIVPAWRPHYYDNNKVYGFNPYSSLATAGGVYSGQFSSLQRTVSTPPVVDLSQIPVLMPFTKTSGSRKPVTSGNNKTFKDSKGKYMDGRTDGMQSWTSPNNEIGGKKKAKSNNGVLKKQPSKNIAMGQSSILRNSKSSSCLIQGSDSSTKALGVKKSEFSLNYMKSESASTKTDSKNIKVCIDSAGRKSPMHNADANNSKDASNLAEHGCGFLKPPQPGMSGGKSAEGITEPKFVSSVDFDSDSYVSSGFCISPHPSALPLPKFSIRPNNRILRNKDGVDRSATRDLRKLLGLG